MMLDKVRPAVVQPLGEVRLSRRLVVLRDDPRWMRSLRVVQWIAALMGLVVLAALLGGCDAPSCKRCEDFCRPLPLARCQPDAFGIPLCECASPAPARCP